MCTSVLFWGCEQRPDERAQAGETANRTPDTESKTADRTRRSGFPGITHSGARLVRAHPSKGSRVLKNAGSASTIVIFTE